MSEFIIQRSLHIFTVGLCWMEPSSATNSAIVFQSWAAEMNHSYGSNTSIYSRCFSRFALSVSTSVAIFQITAQCSKSGCVPVRTIFHLVLHIKTWRVHSVQQVYYILGSTYVGEIVYILIVKGSFFPISCSNWCYFHQGNQYKAKICVVSHLLHSSLLARKDCLSQTSWERWSEIRSENWM